MEQSFTGQEIGGYQIGPLLGVGGMGEVYQAIDSETGDEVAIKFLRSDYIDDTDVQSRFIREIRILESLKHENIVPIYKYGVIDGEKLYYTMRLIKGMAMSTRLKRERFTPQSYGEVLMQVGSALQFAHGEGVVHRDIKPDNIFIEKDDNGQQFAYLGDFGLGKRKGIDVTLTEADAIIGTPHYMSPEGIMGERHDKRSDIYSMAVLSYEALIGVVPFNEPHAHQTAIAHVTQPPPEPSAMNPDFPLVLENWLMQSLSKSMDDRHQTMESFLEDYQDSLNSLTDEERNTVY